MTPQLLESSALVRKVPKEGGGGGGGGGGRGEADGETFLGGVPVCNLRFLRDTTKFLRGAIVAPPPSSNEDPKITNHMHMGLILILARSSLQYALTFAIWSFSSCRCFTMYDCVCVCVCVCTGMANMHEYNHITTSGTGLSKRNTGISPQGM